MLTQEQINQALPRVMTYEKKLASDRIFRKPAANYQEFLERRKWEPLIRKLDRNGVYRTNYINYLYDHYLLSDIHIQSSYLPESYVPRVNSAYDILFRMVTDMDNKILREMLDPDNGLGEAWSIIVEKQNLEEELSGTDYDTRRTIKAFTEEFPFIQEHMEERNKYLESDVFRSGIEDYDKKHRRYEEILDQESIEILEDLESEEDYPNLIFVYRPEGCSSPLPIDWFTKEQIEAFIKENEAPAMTEEEKKIDRILLEINRLLPMTREYYHEYPPSWEKNGLADMIRSQYGLTELEAENNPTNPEFADPFDGLPFQ